MTQDKVDELLKPRYLVIADYPSNDQYKVGQIIEKIGPNYSEMLGRYPHLFRRLEWWEHRTPEEMPEYVKDLQTDSIDKVKWIDGTEAENGMQPMRLVIDAGACNFAVTKNIMCFYSPSTLE